MLVVCHHVGVHSQRFWDHDWLGGTFNHSVFRVDFFFVLSGFVLWAVHRAEAGSIGTGLSFLRRRLWRLYPLLFMLTLIKVLLLWIFPGRSPESYQIIHSLLALPQTNFPVIVSAWTLSFEVYFMVVFATCMALPQRLALLALAVVGTGLVACGVFFGIAPAMTGAGFLTHPFIVEFVLGALAAEVVGQKSSRKWGALFCGVSVAGLLFGIFWCEFAESFELVWPKIFLGAVFASGLGGLVLWERAAAERWWLKDCGLGGASYSIFLSHGFVLMTVFAYVRPELFGHDPMQMNLFLLFVVLVAMMFGLAVAKWMEKPLNKVIRKLQNWLHARHEPLTQS